MSLGVAMKLSGVFAASLAAAASATAVSVSSSLQISHQDRLGQNQRSHEESSSVTVRSTSSNKFAPRFDGLRFIETLVTAHR